MTTLKPLRASAGPAGASAAPAAAMLESTAWRRVDPASLAAAARTGATARAERVTFFAATRCCTSAVDWVATLAMIVGRSSRLLPTGSHLRGVALGRLQRENFILSRAPFTAT